MDRIVTELVCDGSMVTGPPPFEDHQLPRNLADALERAAEHPTAGYDHRLVDGVRLRDSYRAVRREAARIAAGLRAAGCPPGSAVVLQLPDPPRFVAALWGCIAAGVPAAVLACPRRYRSADKTAAQVVRAIAQLERPVVVSDAANAAPLAALIRSEIEDDIAIRSLAELRASGEAGELHSARPEQTALFLHTSGTTGDASLVPVSHRQMLAGALAHAEAAGLGRDSRSLNWLPLTHVSTLSRSVRDVCLAADQLHVATELIVDSPRRMLDLLAEHRSHSVFAPAFGQRLLIAQAAEIASGRWDLAALTCLVSAGEPHSPRALAQLMALLERHGARNAVHTGYGLTEACSTICLGRPLPITDRGVIDSGLPVRGAAIRIVDDADGLVAPGVTGRIQVTGPMVVERSLTGRDLRTGDGWLNTGDLGLVDRGRLTVIDREKEILIVNGVNYPTREVELVAETAREISRAVACNVRIPGEDADRVLVFAIARDLGDIRADRVVADIQSAIRRSLGLPTPVVVVLPASALPQTTKLSRFALRARYLAGEFGRS